MKANESKKTSSQPGVILLQVDGLSRSQFERALHARRMPFLHKLLKRKRHTLKTFYSGQPSCTPGVQAEIHFGAPSATPAFSFFDTERNEDVRMYDAEWARRIADESSREGTKLLQGGSSYANIYTGGAKKAKYCGELNTFAHWTSELSIFRLAKLALQHPFTALHMGFLLFIEIGIAFYDAAKGMLLRGDIIKELTFIPARLAVTISLREAIRAEVIEDIKEGLPIIHANFFGYDEAAHRRGPHSRFAHWTLKGIDRTLKSIYKASRKSDRRDYEIIIFSDHGQEAVIPYIEAAHETIQETVERLFSNQDFTLAPSDPLSAMMERSRKAIFTEDSTHHKENDTSKRKIRIHALGPVAHLYVENGLTQNEKEAWAQRLCLQSNVPIVLFKNARGEITFCRGKEQGSLDLLKNLLVKRGHQFPETTIQDLKRMLATRYVGDLIFFGWRINQKPLTFAEERGAHAGSGAEECRGFAMLPKSIKWKRDWMRPVELRHIAMKQLGREAEIQKDNFTSFTTMPLGSQSEQLRVVSYNVHGGVGVDRRRDATRILSVITSINPDIVCFQEAFESMVDPKFSLRTAMASLWEGKCHFEFLCLHHRNNIRYGLAIASRYPLQLRKSTAFESSDPRLGKYEPRGAMWAEVEIPKGLSPQIINTHFGLSSIERKMQTDILLSDQWLGARKEQDNLVICGDFNAGPRASSYHRFVARFSDAQIKANQGKASASFLSWAPLRRIDHLFTAKHLEISNAGVFSSSLARRASDHLPVFADIKIPYKSLKNSNPSIDKNLTGTVNA